MNEEEMRKEEAKWDGVIRHRVDQSKCRICGSEDIEKDIERKSYVCKGCGDVWGMSTRQPTKEEREAYSKKHPITI